VSVEKRPDGRYRARWRELDGRQRARHFDTKRAATQFLATVQVDLSRGTYVDPHAGKETVGEYAQRWAAGQPWRPSTRSRVEKVLRSQIMPTFGNVPLRALRRSDVQAWVGKMAASGLAPSTVEGYFKLLSSVMRAARRDKFIHESPCEGVRRPRADRSSASLVPLTSAQVQAIADAVPDRYRALVLTSAGLGLRQGEACGLTVDHVEFLARKVRIDRQLLSPPSGPADFGPPKTKDSVRVLPLPESVSQVLAAHIAVYGRRNADGAIDDKALIFTTPAGDPLRYRTWHPVFGSAARAAGLKASSHDLRHHCASLLIASGCSVKAVQVFLGHKTAMETLDTYGHLWATDDDRIRAAIDEGFQRNEDSMRTTAELGG
jgi:integrase